MTTCHQLSGARDKPLFPPGPLTTSRTVKQAMLRDLGSRDYEFIELVSHVRESLLRLAGVSKQTGWEAVLMQGSGTFGLEAALSSAVAPNGKLLVLVNGAYGERLARIATVHHIETTVLRCPEDNTPDPREVDRLIREDPAISAVAIVHCETTSGIMNPVEAVGAVVKAHGLTCFVDSMSAFGAVPLDLEASAVDFLISSANKCLEGVPGFAFVLCRRAALEATEGWARTLSLDLLAQWRGLEANGQFRFTPPTHALLALAQALRELEVEGGVAGRAARYRRNHERLVAGMRATGFEAYVPADKQSHIITSFRYPSDPQFDFDDFYRRLNDMGMVIYPGKVSNADCFRIGNIGRLFESDMQALLVTVRHAMEQMGVVLTAASSSQYAAGVQGTRAY